MEYVYAALILNENDEEINEDNVTAVLEAAGVDVEQSRVKALVAALEDVDIEDAIDTAAAAPAAGGAAGGAAGSDDDDEDDGDEAADEAEEEDAAADEEEEDEEASGEGLGELFG
ncbi:50S ribosomal protein P1 [Haloplanus ruber]|uniref:Large ribosomal subunit protein P1 n=1 Tax=Haloplanus ruber TaxID=869892 RepID=A0ABD6D1F2_9EURY|nr:50S ribosomal protein P1 [Haloplanus ruber]